MAPVGQLPVAGPAQIKAQYSSPVEVCKAHNGLAVVPVGTSVAQDPVESHSGMQASPVKPSIEAETSSERQPPLGFP